MSAARWQALTQEEREEYNRKAAEETSSRATVTMDIKQILNKLAKLVRTYMYVHVHVHATVLTKCIYLLMLT